MTENERNTNKLDTVGYEAITEATIFDSASRQTARMVVPLSFAADEDSEKDYRTNVMPRFEDDWLEASESYAQCNGASEAKPEPLIASEPKRKSFWRYIALTFLVIFILGAGAAGGFALAQYQKQKEEKGVALLPLPTAKNDRRLTELVIKPYEDPKEIAKKTEAEETTEITETEQTKEQKETQPNTTPENSSSKKENNPNAQQNTNSNQSSEEERESKATQPKRPPAVSNDQQKQTQQKPRSTAETAREQIKKIGRRIKDIFSGN